MKKTFTITIGIDTDSEWVESLDVVVDANRTEFLLEGVDEPITIGMAASIIEGELRDFVRYTK